MAFSAYCGLSILHSLMYKKLADAQHRSKLSNELMMYHMKVRRPCQKKKKKEWRKKDRPGFLSFGGVRGFFGGGTDVFPTLPYHHHHSCMIIDSLSACLREQRV